MMYLNCDEQADVVIFCVNNKGTSYILISSKRGGLTPFSFLKLFMIDHHIYTHNLKQLCN